MEIKQLRVINFRNIKDLNWRSIPGNCIITGSNGQGKTNLLETIYLMLNLKPLRFGTSFKPLVNKDSDHFSIRAHFSEENLKYEKTFGYQNGTRNLLLNKQKCSSRQFIEKSYAIFFSPDQAGMVVDSPGERRKLLDRFIFSFQSSHYETLIKYNNLKKRRNAVLKANPEITLLRALDANFVPLVFALTKTREKFIKRLAPIFKEVWQELKPDTDQLELNFKPSVDLDKIEKLKELFENNYERDIKRGRTTNGSHLDDFIFKINNISSKHYLSHGERKIAALSFNLAYLEHLIKAKNHNPLVMLDDIAAELDEQTLGRIFKLLKRFNLQKFITVLDGKEEMVKSVMEQTGDEVKYFSIDQGNLTETTLQ